MIINDFRPFSKVDGEPSNEWNRLISPEFRGAFTLSWYTVSFSTPHLHGPLQDLEPHFIFVIYISSS